MSYKFEIDQNYLHLENPLKNIETIFSSHDESVHEARNVLKIIDIDGVSTVVKYFKIPHLLNKGVYTFFRKSKAYKSYHNAQYLRSLGVETPEPIALFEFFKNSLLDESYFVAKEFKYDFDIRKVLLEEPKEKVQILKEFAHFTFDLHQKGIWHSDYSPGNILIKKVGESYTFSIVDINRMKFKNISDYDGLENFNKLWASEDELTIIATVYAQLGSLDEDRAIKEAISHDRANKRVKNFKKWLKGKK